ncbi:MAG: D-aminoacylase [Gemmatimonadota bacterium]
MLDLIIEKGTVIDGSGAPRQRQDVGVLGDRIAAVGDLAAEAAGRRLDATGRVVSPGFVDVHNHTDAWLLKLANYAPKTAQGITTEVIMADGISYAPVDETTVAEWIYYMRSLNGLLFEEYDGWRSLAEYMARLDGASAQNAIAHLPYGNVRALLGGFGAAPLDDFQMRLVVEAVKEGMEAGAVGLSTGLDYIGQCFSTTDELVEVAAAMAPYRGLFVTHVRYKKGTLAGVKEAVEIGRRAGAPVHISHLKATTPPDIEALLQYIDRVARQEVDFTFDVYPYLPGSTMLTYLLPFNVWADGPLAVLGKLKDPAVRRNFARELATSRLANIHIAWLPGRENARHLGQTLAEYVEEVGGEPADALCNLLIEESLAVLLVFHHGDDALVRPFLSHDCFMMGSDGIYFPDSVVHPRLYGSVPRILGPCVRDHHLFSLEEAVRKLSGFPSERFGLAERGKVREGYFADLVVFDPETVVDRATYQNPHQYPVGIEHVYVNGVAVVADGVAIQDLQRPRPGRALRYRG